MLPRHALTDQQWNSIRDLLPGKPGDPGRSTNLYDPVSCLIATVDPLGCRSTTVYDPAGKWLSNGMGRPLSSSSQRSNWLKGTSLPMVCLIIASETKRDEQRSVMERFFGAMERFRRGAAQDGKKGTEFHHRGMRTPANAVAVSETGESVRTRA